MSVTLLQHAKQLADERGIAAQCDFILATSAKTHPASPTHPLMSWPPCATLAYVADKPRQHLRIPSRTETRRGRISLCEPIYPGSCFCRACPGPVDRKPNPRNPQIRKFLTLPAPLSIRNISFHRAGHLDQPAHQLHRAATDLLHLTGQAGFDNAHLELHLDYKTRQCIAVGCAAGNRPASPGLRRCAKVLESKFSPKREHCSERGFRPDDRGRASPPCTMPVPHTSLHIKPAESPAPRVRPRHPCVR